MNISKITSIENNKNEVDFAILANVTGGKRYNVSICADGRANIFFNCVKYTGFSKRIEPIAQISCGIYKKTLIVPFDGELQIEIHDPKTSELDTWVKINGIVVEEV